MIADRWARIQDILNIKYTLCFCYVTVECSSWQRVVVGWADLTIYRKLNENLELDEEIFLLKEIKSSFHKKIETQDFE